MLEVNRIDRSRVFPRFWRHDSSWLI